MATSSFAQRVFDTDISSVFLNLNDYGTRARFTHGGNPGVYVNVLFNDRYDESDVLGMKAVNTCPAATGKADDLALAAVGDLLEVENRAGEWVTYYIIGTGEDEQGIRTLKLSTQPLHGS